MSRKNPVVVPEMFREKVESLVEINAEYSKRYLAQLPRLEEYKREHPTKVMVFKCMDGRILFSHFTKTPLGYLSNFRNLGGQFNFGWAHLQATFSDVVHEAHREHVERVTKQTQTEMHDRELMRRAFVNDLRASDSVSRQVVVHHPTDICDVCEDGNAVLAIITYHFSEGANKLRGCAGSKCNKEKSLRDAKGFRMQIERACRDSQWLHKVVPIVIGIETDFETLVLHGENGQIRDLGILKEHVSDNELFSIINELYPSMPMVMKFDLLPILRGNVQHRAEVIRSQRPIEQLNHQEWVLGIGRSSAYEWLHRPNTAILIGLFNPDLPKVIRKGLRVIKKHNEKNDFLLVTAACFGAGNPKAFAKETVKYYNRLAEEQVKKYHKKLLPHIYSVKLLVNQETQLFEILSK